MGNGISGPWRYKWSESYSVSSVDKLETSVNKLEEDINKAITNFITKRKCNNIFECKYWPFNDSPDYTGAFRFHKNPETCILYIDDNAKFYPVKDDEFTYACNMLYNYLKEKTNNFSFEVWVMFAFHKAIPCPGFDLIGEGTSGMVFSGSCNDQGITFKAFSEQKMLDDHVEFLTNLFNNEDKSKIDLIWRFSDIHDSIEQIDLSQVHLNLDTLQSLKIKSFHQTALRLQYIEGAVPISAESIDIVQREHGQLNPEHHNKQTLTELIFTSILQCAVSLFHVGFVHNDIKPENIILGVPALRVHLVDFSNATSKDDPLELTNYFCGLGEDSKPDWKVMITESSGPNSFSLDDMYPGVQPASDRNDATEEDKVRPVSEENDMSDQKGLQGSKKAYVLTIVQIMFTMHKLKDVFDPKICQAYITFLHNHLTELKRSQYDISMFFNSSFERSVDRQIYTKIKNYKLLGEGEELPYNAKIKLTYQFNYEEELGFFYHPEALLPENVIAIDDHALIDSYGMSRSKLSGYDANKTALIAPHTGGSSLHWPALASLSAVAIASSVVGSLRPTL